MPATARRSRTLMSSRCWHGAIAAVIMFCLGVQVVLIFSGGEDVNSGDGANSAPVPVRFARLFSYFTIESNIIIGIVCVLLVFNPLRRGLWWEVARLNGLLAITITGLVFAIILAPQLQLTGWALVATIGFHYVSPWATVLGWLIFGPRPRFRWWTIVGAFILPLAWLIYIFTQGTFTRWYPYPFLDVTRIGLGPAVLNAGLVILVAAVLALLFKLIDAKAPSAIRDGSHHGSPFLPE